MTTALQQSMLACIAESEFQPTGGRPPETFEDTDWVWTVMIIEDQQDKGIFTSLVNAGLVEHNGHHNSTDSAVRLTKAGFDAYKGAQS
jgi:hypothetical protein